MLQTFSRNWYESSEDMFLREKRRRKKALVYVKQLTGVYGLTVYIILVLTPSGMQEKDLRLLSEIWVVFSLQSGTVRWLGAPAEPPPFTRCPTPPLTHSTTLPVSTFLHLAVWSWSKPWSPFKAGLHSYPNMHWSSNAQGFWLRDGHQHQPVVLGRQTLHLSAGLQSLQSWLQL